jgi:hypothetical protein
MSKQQISSFTIREEEIKWYPRAKVKELLEGDFNTKYFQLVANEKHRNFLPTPTWR